MGTELPVVASGGQPDELKANIAAAENLLFRDVAGQALVRRVSADCLEAAQHACQRRESLERDRPERTVVLVMGEFNSGKSTLINALVGRVVAATDVMEMTHATCRIVCSDEAPDVVELETDDGGKSRRISLAQFVELSQRRKLGAWTRACAYVRGDLDLVLVDTPGLGATAEHEVGALDTLASADLVLYCLDVGHLGSARDVAVLQQLCGLDMPHVCVLTKVDQLDDSELDETIDYVADDLNLDPEAVFPVHALTALSGHQDEGVERLRRYLRSSVRVRAVSVRERAMLAHARDVGHELASCLGQAEEALATAVRDAQQYHTAMMRTAEHVTATMCSAVGDLLWDRLRLLLEQRLLQDQTLSGDDFLAAFRDGVEADEAFKDDLLSKLEGRYQAEWAEGVKASAERLTASLREAKSQADQQSMAMFEEILRQEQLKKDSTLAAVKGAVLGIGGLFLFGPVGLIAGVPAAFSAWQTSTAAGNPELMEHELHLSMTQWRERVVEDAVRRLYPELLKHNQQVARQAVDGYLREHSTWPLPLALLEALHLDCSEQAKKLR